MQNPVQIGVGTLHNSALQIAQQNKIYNQKYDGYIAVADCSDLGSEYILYFYDKEYFVAASDCLDEQDHYVLHKRYAKNQGFASENKNGNYHWIVDIDRHIWGDAPQIPTIVGIKKIKD